MAGKRAKMLCGIIAEGMAKSTNGTPPLRWKQVIFGIVAI